MSSTLLKLARLLGFFLLTLIIVAYIGGSYFFSSVLIAGPVYTLDSSEERNLRASSPVLASLPMPETIRLENGDVSLEGWYFDHPATSCGVVLLHGYTDTRWGMIPYLPIFWEKGCDLLLYDARGHGNSSEAYHTYGFHEKEDAETAVRWLGEKTNLTLNQIGLIGASYGGATVLQTAPQLPNLGFIIADSAYQDLQTITAHQAVAQYGSMVNPFVPSAFLISELRADFDADEVSPQNAIAQAQMPIMLIHSLQDDFILPAHAETIFAQSNPEQTVLHITDWGAPHGTLITTDFEQYLELVNQFLAEFAPQILR